jgi:exosortase A-associated hydrolase 2
MKKASEIKVLPRFMGEQGEKYFTLQFSSREQPKAHVVYVPPFGEEMNRCRALVSEQARHFARSGYSCTLIDFYGTGDSQGELQDASLQIWQRNIQFAVETLQREVNVPVILWGLRLGAFIALDFAARSALAIDSLLLWQPVVSGERYVTQILRQRVAGLASKELPPETTTEIRRRLAQGESVEVSGYTIGGALIADIESLSLANLTALCSGKIHWLENVSEASAELTTGTAKAIDQLKSLRNDVVVHPFTGPQVWQLHKRDSVPELIAITSSLLR